MKRNGDPRKLPEIGTRTAFNGKVKHVNKIIGFENNNFVAEMINFDHCIVGVKEEKNEGSPAKKYKISPVKTSVQDVLTPKSSRKK